MFQREFAKKTGAVLIALSALLLPACTDNQQATTDDTTEQTETANDPNVTAKEVANNTDALIGKTVSIRSEPEKKISPTTFSISDKQLFGGENILVVNASGETTALPEDTELQVTGKVAKFVTAEVEKEYNLKLDPKLYVEYEGKPAIIAQSIAQAPEPGQITKDPSKYYNKVLAVPGKIEDVESENVFTLDEEELIGANDLLVLVPDTKKATIKDDEKVVVTGVLRPFVVAELEKEYGFSWDEGIKKKLETEYKDKPVLVATSVYPSEFPESKK
ncbi:MAG: hypothetical protein AAF378_22665 [Cyanobacteria bacterium P01_A01_bin.84]